MSASFDELLLLLLIGFVAASGVEEFRDRRLVREVDLEIVEHLDGFVVVTRGDQAARFGETI